MIYCAYTARGRAGHGCPCSIVLEIAAAAAAAAAPYLLFFSFFPVSSGGWVKLQLNPPHFHVSDTCRASIQPDAPVATAARAAAAGLVSMSTRPDPERSGAVEIAARKSIAFSDAC